MPEEKKLTKQEKAEQAEKKAEKEIKDFYSAREMGEINKKLDTIIVKPISNPRETLSSKNMPKLTTGTVLDDILGRGGAVASQLIELFGEYGTGKTQIIMTLVVQASQIGTVVYIDAEYTFSPERLEEICQSRGLDIEKMWKNIILYQPENWMHQIATIKQIPSPADLEKEERPPLKLVVVDSLLSLVDATEDFEGRQNLPVRSRVIRVQILGRLRQLARDHQCTVVFSNQIQDVPDTKPFMPFYMKQRGKGGPTVSHVPDIRLFLRKAASDTRLARLMDSSTLPVGERVYVINAKGIDDVPEETKKKIERTSKKETEKEIDEAEKEADKTFSEETAEE